MMGCPGCNPCPVRVPYNHPVKSGESSEKQTIFYDKYRVFLFHWYLLEQIDLKLWICNLCIHKDDKCSLDSPMSCYYQPIPRSNSCLLSHRTSESRQDHYNYEQNCITAIEKHPVHSIKRLPQLNARTEGCALNPSGSILQVLAFG